MHAPMEDGEDGSARRQERFRGLYDEHARALLGYALRRVAVPADAADVVAEAFLVAWRRLDDVPDAEARPWLFGVTRGVLANHRRGALRRNALADKLRHHLAGQVRVDDPSDTSDAVATVRRAMAQLGSDDRELLQLTTWEGLTPTELAVALGVPAATVRTRLHRARNRLRALLAEPTGRRQNGEGPERNGSNGHVAAGERALAPDGRRAP